MTKLAASEAGEHPPSYIIFLVVFLFFLTGLLGFLICHLLKKKGYHCRTGDLEDEKEKLGEDGKWRRQMKESVFNFVVQSKT
uniref:RELT like 2 n=1 Tax=Poecilia mexicana TaxID=48701 RepID=A0A3B3YTX6_9TELE